MEESFDKYFKKGVKIVMETGNTSCAFIQRELSVKYVLAARILDKMKEMNFISTPSQSELEVKVLITPNQFKETFGEDFDVN